MRTRITLACTECKQRNYNTTKDKKTHPDRMETKKAVYPLMTARQSAAHWIRFWMKKTLSRTAMFLKLALPEPRES